MTEIVTASFHEVEGVKIAFQVVKFAADKWLDFSKQREALADCNSRLDDCHDARSRCVAGKRVLAYVLLFLVGILLIGSMFYTITARSQV
jgi:hypothetical protein